MVSSQLELIVDLEYFLPVAEATASLTATVLPKKQEKNMAIVKELLGVILLGIYSGVQDARVLIRALALEITDRDSLDGIYHQRCSAYILITHSPPVGQTLFECSLRIELRM